MLIHNMYPKGISFDINPNFKFTNSHFHSLKPKIDINESETEFLVSAEIAGVKKENIAIKVNDDNILTIKGTREFELDDNSKFLRSEIQKGKFERKFQLPEKINREDIKANFNNGIVTISIPKLIRVENEIELDLV